ncbi:MAG: bifunctional ADP-dependent NAD(P)H-hydrate dehydratase/NAD(P)H-hydrate epimerase, partial [bacterium]|nr:bifunctional ADP-dependent NAD(P)H-hydrate dehydratase/NAD(P)H-hydrate epimerase [bacterium]
MRLVITPEESNRLDAASVEPVEILMERAGLGVALASVEMGVGYGSRVAILAGAGNNGGDGYVAARYLQRRGAQVTVHALGYPRGDFSPARLASIRAVAAGVRVVDFGPPQPADLVIDALFGVGFRGELPAEILPWLGHDAPVL